ncbi:MAG: hypothetical protein WC961_07205 [Anaerovoracaceae bacterium]
MKVFIGIDPGSSSGAVAWIEVDDNDTISNKGYFEFSKLTLQEWYMELRVINETDSTLAVLEKVHSMPGQGIVSATTFGKNVGHIEMALTAANIPYREVTPQTWIKFYGMKKEKDESKTMWKKRLREKLQQLMPDLKVTNNNADAFLIAYYNWKTQ